jgi:predicted NUDIX family NTP pyrophosphohydrolase
LLVLLDHPNGSFWAQITRAQWPSEWGAVSLG